MNRTMTSSRRATAGFSLIELMVVIAIVAIGLTLAVPYFAGAGKSAKERGVPARLQQDFMWARTAAGASDGSAFSGLGLSGLNPTVSIQIFADCHWITTIAAGSGSAQDPNHSFSATQVSGLESGMTCANTTTPTATMPVTFTFTAQGTLTSSGNVTFTSASGTTWPLMFLMSGSVINTNGLS